MDSTFHLRQNQSKEVQQQGIQSILDDPNIDLELLAFPNIDIMENVSIAFVKMGISKVSKIVPRLFDWLQDLNWPGAQNIFDLLLTGEPDHIYPIWKQKIDEAQRLNDDEWIFWLRDFKRQYDDVTKHHDIYHYIFTLNCHLDNALANKSIDELSKNSHFDFHYLLRPLGPEYWENSARVLSTLSDEKIYDLLPGLLDWLQDPGWPGFDIIYRVLTRIKSLSLLENIDKKIDEAKDIPYSKWAQVLTSLKKDLF